MPCYPLDKTSLHDTNKSKVETGQSHITGEESQLAWHAQNESTGKHTQSMWQVDPTQLVNVTVGQRSEIGSADSIFFALFLPSALDRLSAGLVSLSLVGMVLAIPLSG